MTIVLSDAFQELETMLQNGDHQIIFFQPQMEHGSYMHDEQRRGPDFDEVGLLFKLIGQAIWYLQGLEDALSSSMTLKADVKKRGAVAPDKVKEILANHRRNTLGKSIKSAKRAQIYPEKLQHKLEMFNEERHWIVHRMLHENGGDMNIDGKREAFFARIENFSNEARNLQKEIGEDLIIFVSAQGVGREWIENYARREVAKDRGKKLAE